MINAFRRFLSVRYDYPNQLQQQRAAGLIVMVCLMLPVLVVYDLTTILPGFFFGDVPLARAIVFLLVLPVLSALTYSFARNGRITWAIWLFLIAMYLGIAPFVFVFLGQSMPVLLFVLAIAAGVLLDRRQFMLALVVILLSLVAHALVQNQILEEGVAQPTNTVLSDFGLMVFTVLFSSLLLYAFSGSALRLSEISINDIRHFKKVGEFVVSETEDSLLAGALRVVQSDLGYTLGQIFLLDPDGTVQRRIRLGMGQSELTSSPVINRGNVLVIDEIVTTRQPVLVHGQDEPVRRSHMIAAAHFTLTVPIVNGEEILGALDVQTANNESFTVNQIDAIRSLGHRLGKALYFSRLIADLQQALREREEAAAYMREQLTQLQGGTHRLLQSGWSQYLQSRGTLFGYDLEKPGGSIVPASDLPQEILPALSRGDVVTDIRGDEQVISAPIILRGEVLGAMSFTVPADRAIGEDEIETVRTVANRLGLALENNRLLEQTQAQALRERKATEVANILLTATSIESLMDLAAENFNEALNAINTRIYLEPGMVAEPPAAHGEPA
jgi:GAF domain-containing protein